MAAAFPNLSASITSEPLGEKDYEKAKEVLSEWRGRALQYWCKSKSRPEKARLDDCEIMSGYMKDAIETRVKASEIYACKDSEGCFRGFLSLYLEPKEIPRYLKIDLLVSQPENIVDYPDNPNRIPGVARSLTTLAERRVVELGKEGIYLYSQFSSEDVYKRLGYETSSHLHMFKTAEAIQKQFDDFKEAG